MPDSRALVLEKNNNTAPAASKVCIATTDAEKEEIYRLRYEVYIEEMDLARRFTEVDPSERRMRDELDAHAVQFYIRQKGEIVGCVRVNLRRDGPWECEDRFELEKFAPAYPSHVAMASRFAVHPGARGSVIMMQLSCAMAVFLGKQEQRFCFLDCHPKLLPLYSRLGFRMYRPGFKHPKYTYVIPMVLTKGDLEHLERVNSPLVPILRDYPRTTEWRDLLLRNFPAAAHTFVSANVDEDAFWGLLGGSLLGMGPGIEPSDILTNLTESETKLLVSMGQIVSCRAGDPILSTGEEGREIFLILDGCFQVLGESGANRGELTTVTILVPGEIFGEGAFLASGRRSMTVVAMENSTILVLNAKALDREMTTEPRLAAKVFRNLARIIETKYYDSIQG
jgi:CRP-like cAMP-binding protein/predicted GNAT family N-acyltransferase